MKIEIQSHNFPLTSADENYIRSSLFFALAANQSDIDTVQVWLAELSGEETTKVKYCLIDVKLADGSSVISDISDPEVYVAIHHAVDRAGCRVARSIGRLQRNPAQFQSIRPGHYSRPEVQYSQNSI